jgi:hypothetical protein
MYFPYNTSIVPPTVSLTVNSSAMTCPDR